MRIDDQINQRSEALGPTKLTLLAAETKFQGQTLTPDQTKGYVEFRLAHSYPVVTSYGSCFHPGTVRQNFQSMHHQVFDLRHAVASYHKGTPHEIREDRIIGTILGVEFPEAPYGGWSVTDAEDAPGIHGFAVIHKQAKGMTDVIGQHLGGRHEWTVSLEVDYKLSGSGILLVPSQDADDIPDFEEPTPQLYAKAGLKYVTFLAAPDDLFRTFDRNKGMFTKNYRGWKPLTVIGGVDGDVHFKGAALVEYGAEPTARVDQLLAEDPGLKALADSAAQIAEIVGRL